MTFGAILAFIRQSRGWSQKQVAERLGVSAPYLSDVERDLRPPLQHERIVCFVQGDKAALRLLMNSAAKHRGYVRLSLSEGEHEKVRLALSLAAAWAKMSDAQIHQLQTILGE